MQLQSCLASWLAGKIVFLSFIPLSVSACLFYFSIFIDFSFFWENKALHCRSALQAFFWWYEFQDWLCKCQKLFCKNFVATHIEYWKSILAFVWNSKFRYYIRVCSCLYGLWCKSFQKISKERYFVRRASIHLGSEMPS